MIQKKYILNSFKKILLQVYIFNLNQKKKTKNVLTNK